MKRLIALAIVMALASCAPLSQRIMEADRAFYAHRYGQASDEYRKLLSQKELMGAGKAEVLCKLAASRYLEGEGDRALDPLREAIALDGGSSLPYRLSARMKAEAGDPRGALQDVERALALNSSLETLALAGDVHLMAGRSGPAVGYYQRALRLAPLGATEARIKRNLALALQREGKPEEAIVHFQDYLKHRRSAGAVPEDELAFLAGLSWLLNDLDTVVSILNGLSPEARQALIETFADPNLNRRMSE